MKISSASKKVLASALSAAMVVAFAPTVALGAVVENGGGSTIEETQPEVTGDTVATVTYYKGTTKVTEQFQATDEASYDNAVQAAIVFANEIQANGGSNLGLTGVSTSKPVTVQLQKDVSVDAVYGSDFVKGTNSSATTTLVNDWYEQNDDGTYTLKYKKGTAVTSLDTTKLYKKGTDQLVWNPASDEKGAAIEEAGAIALGGEITFDLNGHTISNTANTEVRNGSLQGAEDGVFDLGGKTFSKGLRTVAAGTHKVTAFSDDIANFGTVDTVATTDVTDANTSEVIIPAGSTLVDAVASSNKAYVYLTATKSYREATDTEISDSSVTKFYQFNVTYKSAAKYGSGTVAAATGKTVITDTAATKGSIASTNATAIFGNGSVTLKDVAIAAKTADGVKADVDGIHVNGDVTVEGSTSVDANVKAASADVAGIEAANVTVKKVKGATAASTKDGSLTVKVAGTNLATNKAASAVKATKFTAEKEAAVDLSATANGAAAANGETGSTVDPSTGLIKDNTTDTAAATGVHSFAVNASDVAIAAGKYSAEYAVANDAETEYNDSAKAIKYKSPLPTIASGSIKYGEFTGHVYGAIVDAATTTTSNLAVTGGIFSESPKATETAKALTNDATPVKAAKYYASSIPAGYAVATDGSKYYVHKAVAGVSAGWADEGTTAEWSTTTSGTTTLSKALIKVEEADKAAEDKTVAAWAANAVATLATGKDAAGVKLSGTDAAAVQKALIDGNVELADGQVSLKVSPKRVDPKSSKLTDAEKQLLSDIDKAADEQSQSVQSVFSISAELEQGKDAKTGKAIKIADVDDMGDTKVKVTVRPVTTNTEAQGVYADGKTFALKMQQAVTNNQNVEASFETSSLGSFGILYSSAADAVKKADKAAAKVVTDEIAKIAADYATVDAKNYEAALAAVAEAEKDYSKLTDAQKKYVSEEQLAQIAQVKAAAEKVKAEQPAAKKANTVKASKKKLTVKVGRKGTFKVTGAKGKVTVKSSSKKKATASISGKKVTVKGLKKGTVTVSVKAAGNASYKAKTVKVTVTVK